MASLTLGLRQDLMDIRPPVMTDGKSLWAAVRSIPELDLNSCYSYYLICAHFHQTSAVAVLTDQNAQVSQDNQDNQDDQDDQDNQDDAAGLRDGLKNKRTQDRLQNGLNIPKADACPKVCGFVTAYLKPDDPSVLFVWQLGVCESMRGRRLASRLLHDVLSRDVCKNVTSIETTIASDNAASLGVFEKLALELVSPWSSEPFLTPEDFPKTSQEILPEALKRDKGGDFGEIKKSPKAGESLGSKIGSKISSKIGSTIGSTIGSAVDSIVDSAVDSALGQTTDHKDERLIRIGPFEPDALDLIKTD